MNRRADIAGFLSKVRATTAQVLDAEAAQSSANVKDALSTPYPPPSSPGESPHKRTGNLQTGVSHETTVDDKDVTAAVKSERTAGDPRVPFWLEHGTERGQMAARPYMGPEQQAAGPRAHAAHAAALREIRP